MRQGVVGAMRIAIITSVLAVVGCAAQQHAPSIVASGRVSVVQFESCGYQVSFPQTAEVSSVRPSNVPSNADYKNAEYQHGGSLYLQATCTCVPGARPSEQSRTSIEYALQNSIKSYLDTNPNNDIQVTRISVADASYGKHGILEAVHGATKEEHQSETVHLYFLEKCVLTTIGVTGADRITDKRFASAFLQSVTEIGSKSEAAEGAAGARSPEIAERLRRLQTLRDQGLISAEEYRSRRQAILDSL